MIYHYEQQAFNEGYQYICGVDEVGRGPLAGPVVAAAVILKPGVRIDVIDSKKLTPKQRQALVPIIQENSLAVHISFISETIIDEINILNASKQAMIKAVEGLSIRPDYILSDAIDLSELSIANQALIKGDLKSASIAAASIIAKEARDRYMDEMDLLYPQYGFKKHKGYPTKMHIEQIKTHGITKIHRKTFKPIKTMLENR